MSMITRSGRTIKAQAQEKPRVDRDSSLVPSLDWNPTPQEDAEARPKVNWSKFDQDTGFEVKIVKSTTTSSEHTGSGSTKQQDNWPPLPKHKVTPEEFWDASRPRDKVDVNILLDGNVCSHTVEVDDVILIKSDPKKMESLKSKPLIENWVARVLEIRIANDHPYFKIRWLYLPEELPTGRQPYHGFREVIPSNFVDVISASSLTKTVDFLYYPPSHVRSDDDVELGASFYWRQTIDVMKGNKVSGLPKYCVDCYPENPEDEMGRCDACRQWFHDHCFVKAAVEKYCNQQNIKNGPMLLSAADRPSKTHKDFSPSTSAEEPEDTVTGKLLTLPNERSWITVTDRRDRRAPSTIYMQIYCLNKDCHNGNHVIP